MNNKLLKYIYYARGMDGLNPAEIMQDYNYVKYALKDLGMTISNPLGEGHTLIDSSPQFFNTATDHEKKKISAFIYNENMENLLKSDGILLNMTLPNRMYVGCISEMIEAKRNGLYVVSALGANRERLLNNHYMQYCNDALVDDVEQALQILSKVNISRKGLITTEKDLL